MAQFTFIPSGDAPELGEDIRRLFDDLAANLPREQRAWTGECHPPLDVIETDEAVEIIIDVCGIAPDAIRVLFRDDVLIVAGEKAPPPANQNQAFHLVEREFGRFARAVRLKGAFDVTAGRADIAAGELTIVLPKRTDRRGRAHVIRVDRSGSEPGA
jgi:HSP20 family protein